MTIMVVMIMIFHRMTMLMRCAVAHVMTNSDDFDDQDDNDLQSLK